MCSFVAPISSEPSRRKTAKNSTHSSTIRSPRSWRRFRAPKSFRILRGRWYEEGAPDIYMTIELTFDRMEDIDTMLASPERAKNIEKIGEIMPLFEGRVFHINHQVTAGEGAEG